MKFTQKLCTFLCAVVLVTPALADEEFNRLTADFESAQNGWFEKVNTLMAEGGEAAMADPSKMPPSPVKEYLPKVKAYAERKTGTPDALPALKWILQNAQFDMNFGFDPGNPVPPVHPDAKWAADQVGNNHAADPNLTSMMESMPFISWVIGREPAIDLLQKIADKNPDKSVKAGARYSLGSILFEEPAFMMRQGDQAKEDPKRSAEKQKAMELFRSVARDFPDSEFAPQAAAFIFEAENLQIGMKAPEIVGQDAEGMEIKLSQFMGQVVVLDFWGFW